MAYNDGKLQAIVLNTRGQLDTTNPPTDRDPGTLVAADDMNHTYLGPREGVQSSERTSTHLLVPSPPIFNGTDVYYYSGDLSLETMTDVPKAWTLDAWINADLSGTLPYTIFHLKGTRGEIKLSIDASSKIAFSFTGTSVRGTAASAYSTTDTGLTLTTNTPYHIRIAKNSGTTIEIRLNGNDSGYSVSNANLGYPIEEALTGAIKAYYIGATSTGADFFKGYIYGVMLRNGCFTDLPMDVTLPTAVPAGTHFYYLPDPLGAGYYRDYSPYTLHARGFGTILYSTNVNTYPSLAPVQGVGTFTNNSGRICQVVVVGGVIYSRYDK